jgi:DNA-binding MarR family transcriptional regulator
VERTPACDDRRRRQLALTPDGERLLHTAQKLVGARLEPLVASLAPHDAEALAALLRRIEPALTGTAPPRRPPPPPPGHHPPPP